MFVKTFSIVYIIIISYTYTCTAQRCSHFSLLFPALWSWWLKPTHYSRNLCFSVSTTWSTKLRAVCANLTYLRHGLSWKDGLLVDADASLPKVLWLLWLPYHPDWNLHPPEYDLVKVTKYIHLSSSWPYLNVLIPTFYSWYKDIQSNIHLSHHLFGVHQTPMLFV